MTDTWVPEPRDVPDELEPDFEPARYAAGGVAESSALVMLGRDEPEFLIPLPQGQRINWAKVADKIDHATLAQLRELMHYGLGDTHADL